MSGDTPYHEIRWNVEKKGYAHLCPDDGWRPRLNFSRT
jgi:hypothetical protein